jgi:TRAP-type uncharacterized transport system substrate-binding protein
MKAKQFLSLIIGLFAIVQFAQGQVTVYCGEEGTATFQMAKDLEENCKGSSVNVQPTEKLIESFRALKPGEVCFIQYDILQQEMLNDLKNGTSYTGNVQLLLPLGNEEIHLITLQENSIRDFKDLDSKKVAVGKSGQAMRMTIEVLKTLTDGKWVDQEMSFNESVKALLNKEIDGMFFVGSAPSEKLKFFSQIAGAKNLLRLVPITDKRLMDSYTVASLRTGTYSWAMYQVETFAARSVLVSKTEEKSDAASTQTLKKFLEEIRANMVKLQKNGHANWRRVNYVFDGLIWDVHPAAKQVFMPSTDDTKKDGSKDAAKDVKKDAAKDVVKEPAKDAAKDANKEKKTNK